MPLIKREVEPVLVSRVDIGSEIQNELECVTNYTLASIIRQLSNLGKHAEDIFGELYREAMFLSGRANTLQDRIDKLSDKVTKLDATRDQGEFVACSTVRDVNGPVLISSRLPNIPLFERSRWQIIQLICVFISPKLQLSGYLVEMIIPRYLGLVCKISRYLSGVSLPARRPALCANAEQNISSSFSSLSFKFRGQVSNWWRRDL